MSIFFVSFLALLQTATTGVEVQVYNAAANEPVSGIQVVLETFAYQDGEALRIEKQTCTTDEKGNCTLLLEKPNRNGMQRGILQIGDYGIRDLVWPGGMQKISIPVDQLDFGREAAPDEYLPEDGGVVVHRGGFPLYAFLMILLLIVISVVIYRHSQIQEISQ